MIFLRVLTVTALTILAAGCSVTHGGTISMLNPPLFQLELGDYSSITVFPGSTIIRIHDSNNHTIIVSNYLIVGTATVLALLLWYVRRQGKHQKASGSSG